MYRQFARLIGSSSKPYITVAAFVGLVLGLTAPAWANVIYIYTGNDFTIIPPGGPWTTSDRVTVTMTLTQPLPLNYMNSTPAGLIPLNLVPNLIALSLSDGVRTIDLNTPDLYPGSPSVLVYTTDASGSPTQWAVTIAVEQAPGSQTIGQDITTYHVIQPPQIGDDAGICCAGGGGLDATSFVPGTWTLVTPTANAGPNETVLAGSLVTLDGSASSSASALLPLTYAWSFASRPAGSTATLSNPTSVNPTFTVDQPGNYVVQLVVTNTAGFQSAPSTVNISTTNSPPVASAGPNQFLTQIGRTITLDGGQSYDPDGDPITYQWSLVSIPTGSKAVLSNPNTRIPTFIADVHGTYIAQLIVSDLTSQSAPSQVTISSENLRPLAIAGTSQSAIAGEAVTLNGSASHDLDGDPLTYQWSFASVPSGSGATIASPTSVVTSFVPDLPGTYVVQLIVNDGYADSVPSSFQVQVVTLRTAAIQQTQAIQTTVAAFPPTAFVNANMQNQLNNKLNAVIRDIQAGDLASALDQLQNDILLKTDGCTATGAPEKDDWINNCTDQNQLYPEIQQLIQLLLSGVK